MNSNINKYRKGKKCPSCEHINETDAHHCGSCGFMVDSVELLDYPVEDFHVEIQNQDSGKLEKQSNRNKSARTVLWLSGILIFIGFTVLSPAPKPFLFSLAALFSLSAILSHEKAIKIISVIVTVFAFILAIAAYPAYKTHMDGYLNRIQESSQNVK